MTEIYLQFECAHEKRFYPNTSVCACLVSVGMAANPVSDQEGQIRLRALKNWMQKKKLPKSFQIPITECHTHLRRTNLLKKHA